MADLGGDPFDRRAREGQRGQEVGMTVPGHHLGGCRLEVEPEPIAHIRLDGRGRVCICSDGTRDGTHSDAGDRVREPVVVALDLERPRRELEAE